MDFLLWQGTHPLFVPKWNTFDFLLVAITYIPERLVPNSSAMIVIRILRVLRVLRLLRASKEIKLIVTVLLKSMTAMFYNMLLFLVFIYLFAIIGVGLFKMPDAEAMTQEEKVRYEEFMKVAPNNPVHSDDPYGSLDEAMFTVFRSCQVISSAFFQIIIYFLHDGFLSVK